MTSYENTFHSINGLSGDDHAEKQLHLKVTLYNSDSVEIEITNRKYLMQRLWKFKLLLGLVTTFVAYNLLMAAVKQSRMLATDLGFLAVLFYLTWSTSNLVKSEKVLFCSEFALQIFTERFLSRKSSLFIPASNIYDIVINEVIQDLAVNYILIVRTKGSLFATNPIIPILTALKPRVDCLEIAYKYLNQIIEKSSTNS